MSQRPLPPITPLQQTILDVVHKYPGQFARSGLAKMLVGAKSWQNTDFPEYGRLTHHRRKDLDYQIEILLQQHYLRLDDYDRLMPNPSSVGQA